MFCLCLHAIVNHKQWLGFKIYILQLVKNVHLFKMACKVSLFTLKTSVTEKTKKQTKVAQ